jgi:prevent-host-death family protein
MQIPRDSLDCYVSPSRVSLMKSFSIAEASNNLKRWVDRVCRKGESYEVVEKGVPCARLVPVPRICTAHEFAQDLGNATLDPKDEAAYSSTIRKGRKLLKPIKNPWA